MVTIVEIAREAKVSKSTVSAVLNHDAGARICTETQQKVLQVAERLGYSANQAARSLRSGHSRLIGLLFSPDAALVIHDVIAGVEEVLHRANYNTVLCSFNSPADLNFRLNTLSSKRPDGWLIIDSFGAEYYDCIVPLCNQAPTVLIGGPPVVSEMLAVYVDPAAIVRAATDYIYRLGHRDVLFAASYRGDDFTRMFTAAWGRLTGNAGHCRVLPRMQGFDCGGMILDAWMERRESVIYAYDDVMAAGILSGAHWRGIPVPEAFSLLGTDNYPICELLWPKLTTIDQDHTEQGRVGARLLLAHLENPDAAPRVALVEPHLAERETFRVGTPGASPVGVTTEP